MTIKPLNVIQSFILCLAILIFPPFVSAAQLKIYHIDVEQGDATLLVSPSGKTLLVDSGKNGHGDRLKKAMDDAGVNAIDFFVCTHYHEDHYGGIDDLVNDYGVTVFSSFDRGDKQFLPADKKTESTYKNYQQAVGEDATHLVRKMAIPFDPEITVTCISSGGVVIDESNPVHGQDENDMSTSLLINYKGFKYFVGGDIEEATESKIAQRDLVVDIDVYQADHHGSSTSSSPSFMKDLKPTVIVISNGNNGTYKHPRQSTLDFYETLPGPPNVYQTNRYLKGGSGGNVSGNRIGDPETIDRDGTILVTVNENGTFVVSYKGNAGDSFNTKFPEQSLISQIVIESLLPNPVGSDDQLEEIVLKNIGTQPVSLTGWKFIDRSNLSWDLSVDGSVAPNTTMTVVRNSRPLSLNNSGDEIKLVAASGAIVDLFNYSTSSEGGRITTGH